MSVQRFDVAAGLSGVGTCYVLYIHRGIAWRAGLFLGTAWPVCCRTPSW